MINPGKENLSDSFNYLPVGRYLVIFIHKDIKYILVHTHIVYITSCAFLEHQNYTHAI